MTDLHATLTARLDELERIAQIAGRDSISPRWVLRMIQGAPTPEVAEHIATWDPATVLRGLAEDRDILARHRATRWPNVEDGYDAPTCAGCGRDNFDDPRYLVPRPEVLSLARRHGIEVDHG